MKHKISCEICEDLITLVKNGNANDDIKTVVKNHIEHCNECKERHKEQYFLYDTHYDTIDDVVDDAVDDNLDNILYYTLDDNSDDDIDKGKSSFKTKRKYGLILVLVVIFSILLGVGITTTENQFYNILLMPVIGILGYIIFRYKASYIVPIFIIIIRMVYILVQNILGIKTIYDFTSLLMYDLIYYFFIVLGIIIAGLIHFDFKTAYGTKSRLASVGASVIVVFIIGLAFGRLGNPISEMVVRNKTQNYIETTYKDKNLYLDKTNYSYTDFYYYTYIRSKDSIDTKFTVSYDLHGNFKYDNYNDYVLSGVNTMTRLVEEYDRLINDIINEKTYGVSNIKYITGNLNLMDNDGNILDNIEIDKIYDTGELGKDYGEISIYFEESNYTIQNLCDVLIKTKQILDDKNIYFKTISVQMPGENDYNLQDFKPEDIFKQDLEKIVENKLAIVNKTNN